MPPARCLLSDVQFRPSVFQKEYVACRRAADLSHRLEKTPEKKIDIRGLNFDVEKVIERARFRFSNFVIRLIQGKYGAEAKLLTSPVRERIRQCRVDDLIALLKSARDVVGSDIQFCELTSGNLRGIEKNRQGLPSASGVCAAANGEIRMHRDPHAFVVALLFQARIEPLSIAGKPGLKQVAKFTNLLN